MCFCFFARIIIDITGDVTLQAYEDNEQVATYDQLVRQLVSNEEKYISHLNLILKVFKEPFITRPDLFPAEVR